MTRREIIRRLLACAITVTLLILLQTVLVRWAASRDVATAVLSGGPHTPTRTLLLAGAMLFSRIVMLLCVPAIVVQTAGMLAFDWWMQRRNPPREGPGERTQPPQMGEIP